MSFSLGKLFHDVGHSIASFFENHHAVIQTVIADAQQGAKAATLVAATLGEPPSVTDAIARVSDGLNQASATVTAESSAGLLSDHAANLAALVTGLVSSGDLGIKNAETKAAIGAVAIKVQGVVGALETAATVPAVV